MASFLTHYRVQTGRKKLAARLERVEIHERSEAAFDLYVHDDLGLQAHPPIHPPPQRFRKVRKITRPSRGPGWGIASGQDLIACPTSEQPYVVQLMCLP